jgi:uncharacterized protein
LNHLLIFIKNPLLGQVKTRLAATLGAAKALDIYHELSAITRQVALKTDAERHLFYSHAIIENDEWSADFFQKKLQKDTSDLGERMSAAFADIFEKNTTTDNKILIIGSDCPTLTADIVQKAFQYLDTNEVVIGGADDGGYYLLGMKTYYPELFSNMEWSVNTVLSETIKRAQNLNLSVFLLPFLSDIDTESDYLAWKGLSGISSNQKSKTELLSMTYVNNL